MKNTACLQRAALAALLLQALAYQMAAQSYQNSSPPGSLSSGGGSGSAKADQFIDYVKPYLKTAIILGFAYCLFQVIWSYQTGQREKTRSHFIGLIVALAVWFLSGAIFSDFGINFSF